MPAEPSDSAGRWVAGPAGLRAARLSPAVSSTLSLHMQGAHLHQSRTTLTNTCTQHVLAFMASTVQDDVWRIWLTS